MSRQTTWIAVAACALLIGSAGAAPAATASQPSAAIAPGEAATTARFSKLKQQDNALMKQISRFLGKTKNVDSWIFGNVADQAIEAMSAPNAPFSVRLKDGSWRVSGERPHDGGTYTFALVDKEGVMRAVGLYFIPSDTPRSHNFDDRHQYWIYVKASPLREQYVADMKTFKDQPDARVNPNAPVKVVTFP